jgi:hypothetical protein
MPLASRRKVMDELTLPVYLRILGWAGHRHYRFRGGGHAFYVRAIDTRFVEAFPRRGRVYLLACFRVRNQFRGQSIGVGLRT